jgi:hypothetical protein
MTFRRDRQFVHRPAARGGSEDRSKSLPATGKINHAAVR